MWSHGDHSRLASQARPRKCKCQGARSLEAGAHQNFQERAGAKTSKSAAGVGVGVIRRARVGVRVSVRVSVRDILW